jgi:hypothetical protein
MRRWYDLEYATGQSPQQRAQVHAAVLQANKLSAQAAAEGGDPMPYRDGAWFRRAHQVHEQLSAFNEYADLNRSTAASSHAAAVGSVPRCAADPDTTRAWLAGPSDQPGITLAEQLGIDEQFHLQSVTLAGDLNTLITAAGGARVFGVPGHHIELWIVTDNDHLVDGHLLSVDFPGGTRLASYHLPADDLIDGDLDGIDAAVGVLVNAKQVVDELLEHYYALRPAGPAAGAAATLAATSFTTTPQPATAPPAPDAPTSSGQAGSQRRSGGARHGR